jgi:hypothetical protein
MSMTNAMTGSVFPCDWAEVVGGKLYAQGMGWTTIAAEQPTSFAAACLIRVPYDETNKKHSASISLTTDDGHPYPQDQAIEARFDFELGRPPGIRHGEEQIIPLAFKVNGLPFPRGGYRFELAINGILVDKASFFAR